MPAQVPLAAPRQVPPHPAATNWRRERCVYPGSSKVRPEFFTAMRLHNRTIFALRDGTPQVALRVSTTRVAVSAIWG